MPKTLLALALLAAASFADEPPARVGKTRGPAAVQPQGSGLFAPDPRPEGRRLDPGDRFRTLEGGYAHLALPLGAVAALKPNTTLVLERAGTAAQAAVLEGDALFGLTRPLDRGWSLSVRVHGATAVAAGQRRGAGAGPGFWAYCGPDREARFAALAGTLRVRAEGRAVRLRAGQETRVPYGRPPSEPRPARFPEGFVRTFAIAGSLSGAEEALGLAPAR
ncbi:MAG: hypothetical protein HY554_19355 [Elusimicrobia bacterium]|nr:hypothetical protein [Elusimicrobiota bacterium]